MATASAVVGFLVISNRCVETVIAGIGGTATGFVQP